MRAQRKDGRILIYSHDTFGLGHLRRCRVIAHALVERYKQLSVLILSGSPIIGSFDFRARVDFVRVPGVIKLRNGDYTPLNLHLDIGETLSMRASIIQHTAEIFDPDLFIVDKEPDAALRAAHPLIAGVTRVGGYPAGRTSLDAPIARAISKAVADAAGGSIVRLPTIGGSAPFYLFSDVLKVPTIGLSIVNFDNNQHGPNENVRIKNIWEGIESMAAILAMP